MTAARPAAGRDPLAVAAVLLAVTAFAGSFDHVRTVVADHGQTGWLSWAIAAMPEVSVMLAVLKVRRARSTGEPVAWAWVVGGSAAAFTLAANIATAEPSPWGVVVAAWPAWASISAAGLLEVRPAGDRTRPVMTADTGQEAVTPAEPRPVKRPAGIDVTDLLMVGQAVAADLDRAGQRITRAALQAGVRARGHTCSTGRAQALLTAVRDLDRTA